MMETQFTGLGIHVKVKDVMASRKFYEGLGFKPVFGYGSDAFRATLPEGCPSVGERYQGVTYDLTDDCQLEVADGHLAARPEAFQEEITSAKVSAMVKVKSLVPLAAALKPYIKFPVRKYYWNSLEIAVRDPDGFVLVFITPYNEQEFDELSKIVGNIEVVEPAAA